MTVDNIKFFDSDLHREPEPKKVDCEPVVYENRNTKRTNPIGYDFKSTTDKPTIPQFDITQF
jgi:hypothetical protein